jgi:glycosyltransferase involved in cell wall biosynthesis
MARQTLLLVMSSLEPGGAERNIVRVANAMSERAEVYLAVARGGALSKTLSPRVSLVDLGGPLGLLLRLPRLVRRIRPRMILSSLEDVNVLLLILRIVRLIRVPLIPRLALYPFSQGQEGVKEAVLTILGRYLYRYADRIIVLTGSMREALVRDGGVPWESISVIENPVDISRLPPTVHRTSDVAEKLRIVSVGRLHFQKGYDVLLRSLAVRPLSELGLELTLVGDGPEAARLEKLAAVLGVEHKVRFAGRVDDPIPLVARSDLYVLSSRYEGLSNAMLEALCLGVPVVAVEDKTSAADVISEGVNGFLVRAADKEELAKGIFRASSELHRLDREQIARDARERYSVDRAIRDYGALLLEG